MEEEGVDFGKGDEDKPPFVKMGMRNPEIFRFDSVLIIKKEIQIDLPRTPPEGLPASQVRFNGLEGPEEFTSRQIRLQFDDAIDEPILSREAKGFRLVEGRLREEPVVVNSQDFRDSFFTLKDFVSNV